MSESDPRPTSSDARPRRSWRWSQFRLRTLLVILSLLAILSAIAGRHLYLQQQRLAAVTAIRELGGLVANRSGKLVASDGDRVERVFLSGITDQQLRKLAWHLSFLPHLRELDIVESEVTDAGLAELEGLTQLERLFVYQTRVTSDGLARLNRSLPHLLIKQELPDPIATGLVMRPIYRHAVAAMQVSPNGRWLAAGDGRGELWLWELDAAGLPAAAPRRTIAHTSWLFDVAFSSDGLLLATGGGDNRVVVWEVETLRRVAEFTGHHDDVHAVTFAQADRLLASAGDDGTVRIWDVDSRQEKHTLVGHREAIVSLAEGWNGTTLASGSRDGDIRLWNLANGELIGIRTGHSGDVSAVAFDPDGHTLVSASYDKTIRLWQQQSDRPIRIVSGHTDWLFTTALTDDGHLVSGGRDGTLRLWDAATGRLIALRGHQGTISRIAAVPGHNLLAVATAEGRITFWDRSLSGCRETLRLDFADPNG